MVLAMSSELLIRGRSVTRLLQPAYKSAVASLVHQDLMLSLSQSTLASIFLQQPHTTHTTDSIPYIRPISVIFGPFQGQ
jgi:hypothetical protein